MSEMQRQREERDDAYDTAIDLLRTESTVEAAKRQFIDRVGTEAWAMEQFDAAGRDFEAESLI